MSVLEKWSKEKLIAYIENIQLKNQQLRKEKKSIWQELEKSKQREVMLLKEIEGAYAYLKATYDIHTWKDEPEYQMMKSFEQVIEKYKELEK